MGVVKEGQAHGLGERHQTGMETKATERAADYDQSEIGQCADLPDLHDLDGSARAILFRLLALWVRGWRGLTAIRIRVM
jgi:hypothetical protein